MSLRLTILGCGSSGGVPRPGQGWGACDPAEPKNRRLRCALLVERSGPDGVTRVLVDTGPDLRQQLLNADVRQLDGVLLTHAHADHIHGIDDLRPLVIEARKRMDIYMDEATAGHVLSRFGYIFETPPGSQYPPLANRRELRHGVGVRIDGPGGPVEALPFELDHGDMCALGFRFGGCAYTPDVIAIPKASQPWLKGLDLWIVDALRYMPHPSHSHVEQTLGWIRQYKPQQAILTNLHTDLDYNRLSAEVPQNVLAAYDGMKANLLI
ncbi:MAG: MBL fold metallo-hydrolase [Alphaproteobacteria bacterium]|nr:MBL fold metallo-hydrolase [Alphaproteobacteria bacterium]